MNLLTISAASEWASNLKKQKISGIFCSPPYVGQIDYHEQHAYAYDLLGFTRKDDFDIFLVANDKYNLYPEIAEKSGMMIVSQFRRPVLNRTERDRNPYSEIIFHFKSL